MEEKKMKLDLKQFENVNYFNGIDRGNLVIQAKSIGVESFVSWITSPCGVKAYTCVL